MLLNNVCIKSLLGHSNRVQLTGTNMYPVSDVSNVTLFLPLDSGYRCNY